MGIPGDLEGSGGLEGPGGLEGLQRGLYLEFKNLVTSRKIIKLSSKFDSKFKFLARFGMLQYIRLDLR